MKRLHNLFMLIVLCGAALQQGCIENDLPYPVVELRILGIEGDGFSVEEIDTRSRTVTLRLEETTDISRVRFSHVELTEQASSSIELEGPAFDLRTPLYVTLSLYQDYEWTIRAEQEIERIFTVENQVGATEFDVEHYTARAYVPMNADLSNITVTRLKLGPEGITHLSLDKEELTSFNPVRYVDVHYHDFEERWALYVVRSGTKVSLTQADGWARILWLYGEGRSGTRFGFRYRKQGDDTWIDVSGDRIQTDGGSFKARISGVEPASVYEVKAYSDSDETEIQTVRTEPLYLLPGGGFEEWHQNKSPWYPYAEGGTEYWGSGNPGATTIGSSYNVTLPDTDTRPGSTGKYAAKLSSRYVILKFAAGNLFTGRYLGTRGTNGIVGFGRPCTSRPVALHGWMKYECGVIDKINNKLKPQGVELIEGVTPDNGIIYIAVGTWTAAEYSVSSKEPEPVGDAEVPVAIDTRDQSTFFNPKGKDVIGYGERIWNKSTDGWIEFTIPLDYKATNLVPTHIIVVCSASRYGDYFTGSTKSTLWVDDFELLYE